MPSGKAGRPWKPSVWTPRIGGSTLRRPSTATRLWTILIVVALSGCVTVKVAQPVLPTPEWPYPVFEACRPGYVCLKDVEANKVNKFIDKWNAYRHSLERLLEDRGL